VPAHGTPIVHGGNGVEENGLETGHAALWLSMDRHLLLLLLLLLMLLLLLLVLLLLRLRLVAHRRRALRAIAIRRAVMRMLLLLRGLLARSLRAALRTQMEWRHVQHQARMLLHLQ